MATAVVEERQLLKSLRWWDGFVIALCNPGFLIAFVGFTMDAVGAWGALFLWATASAIGLLQAWIYSETAAMFPDKPGGISLYAHEGWRGRFSLIGPMGAFGYWIGWSVVLSIFGKVIGDLVISKWFPSTTWHFSDGVLSGGVTVNDLIGIGCIVLVWLLNVYGIRPAVWISYVTGIGLVVPLVVIMILPYLTGHWHASNLKWNLHGFGNGGFGLIMVWLFLNGWSAYGVEVCATFAPEYKNTRRDTAIALRSAAMFCLLVFVLYPLGLGGEIGAPKAALAEGQYLTGAFATIVGSGWASFVVVCLIGSLFLSMISSTADASRALYGIARDDMTVKQLYHLNKHHVPGRAMTVDMVVNTLLILFISSNVAILYMSNIGYILCHILALTGFLLLRHDRPNWPRPIKVGTPWVVIAGLLAVLNLAFLVYGVANPELAYAVSFKDVYIGFGILVGSILLFVFRRVVQDRMPITFRDVTPTMPTPEQMALLQDEVVVGAPQV
jgi:amino acid transporter